MTSISPSPSSVSALLRLTAPATLSSSALAGTTSSASTGTGSAAPTQDSAQISGQSVLLARLFPGQDPSAASAVRTAGSSAAGQSIYSFLTTSDRGAIASLYGYARGNGVDPVEIDHIAFDLGNYRSNAPGVLVDTVGKTFDESGNPVTYTFNNRDEENALAILGSRAANDSALPRDFLDHVLDPGVTAGNHASDFALLKKIVYATSDVGFDGSRDPAAVIAPRPLQRLAQMKAAGLVATPEKVRAAASGPKTDSSFAQYAQRLGLAAGQLLDADKNLLGPLYAAVADKHGPDSKQMKQVDELARTLAMLRPSCTEHGRW